VADEPIPQRTALLPHFTRLELGEIMAALQERIATLTVVARYTQGVNHARTQDAITVCQSILVSITEARMSLAGSDELPEVVDWGGEPHLMTVEGRHVPLEDLATWSDEQEFDLHIKPDPDEPEQP